MAKTEIPSGDQPLPEASPSDSTVKIGAGAKVTKASTGERVLIGILIALVVIVAIGGLVMTLVLDSRKRNAPKDYYEDDNYRYYDDANDDDTFFEETYGPTIEENPFEIDVSQFSSDITEPYASIEDLRNDLEVLAKVLANAVILEQANMHSHRHNHYHDEWGPVMEKDIGMSAPTVATSSKNNGVPGEFFRGMDDFATYQHETGAVKDDTIKSNGSFVFAASDNRIEVWDTEGNLFETIKMKSSGKYEHDVYINSLVMNPEGTKLIVIASDYSDEYHHNSIIDSRGETLVAVFDIEGSSLTKISEAHVDGYHSSSYSVGNHVHVVTKSSLNTWRHFDDHLYRYNFASSSTNAEYVELAKTAAEEKIIPKFVDSFVELVTQEEEIFISPIIGFPDGYRSITLVNSFDINEVVEEGDLELTYSKSLALSSGHTGYVYTTDEWLWVSDENWAWGPSSMDSLTKTTLLGFRFDGPSTNFAAATTIPGQLLSQFSIDFTKKDEKEYIRIAITQNSFETRWWQPRPFPAPVMDTSEVDEAQDESKSRTLNEIIIFEVPNEDNGIVELVKLGSLEVGKKDEIITAIRFFDKLSYVVTFERTDPFYVLDLSDPENPSVLGELEIPGFSEFMHPITADNSILLTVGQDANEFGVVTGFQISIFDSTDPSDPKLVDRLVLEGGSSSASWDERSFRYIQVGGVGRLIIPLYEYNLDRFGQSINNMDGFAVFGIDLSKTEALITREIDVNHYSNHNSYYDDRGCYCGSVWLPQRSLIFDGNLMTMKNSLVVSTDLGSGETRWSMDLQANKANCCMP